MTVQRQCTSAVTELSQDALVGSALETGTTIIQCALRQHDLHAAWGTAATLCGRKASDPVDVHAWSTFHHPLTSRCLVAQGSSGNDQDQRLDCTPTITGVSTSQPRSHSVSRVACSRAVVCGVSLRHRALRFAALCWMPLTTSSIQRGMDAMGPPWPTPEARRRHLRARAPATACPMDGSDPVGTDHGGMGVQDEPDRLLMPHEVASEQGEEARQCLQPVTDLGLHGTAACSDDAPSCTEALQAVVPPARLHADHFHTVTHSWGHLTQSLLSSRRQVKASGTETNAAPLLAMAQQLGQVRWRLLKKPAHLSLAAKQAMTARERDAEGFVHRCRRMSRQLVHSFDHWHSEAQAKCKLQQLRQAIHAVDDDHRQKMPP